MSVGLFIAESFPLVVDALGNALFEMDGHSDMTIELSGFSLAEQFPDPAKGVFEQVLLAVANLTAH